MNISKHRDQLEIYSFNFGNSLDTNETISTPVIQVIHNGEDKTTEFEHTIPAFIQGTQVKFWLKAAASAEQQLAGRYLVYCKVNTSLSRTLVAQDEDDNLILLKVSDNHGI